mgnify:CR=1 FL=1
MSKERLYIFDTTLRDGAKTQGVHFSIDEKTKIALEKELTIKDVGSEIAKVIENNLRKSGLFNPLHKEAFLQKSDIAHHNPRFEDRALIKSQALITGKVS